MEQLTASLILERGPRPNQRFILSEEQTNIGRSAGNEVVIVDPEVSRRHARITRRTADFALEDLGSTNGTFLNGHRVTHLTILQDGDVIDLGDSISLRFVTTVAVPTTPVQPEAPVDQAAYYPPSAVPTVEDAAIEWNEPQEDVGDFVYYSGPEAELFGEASPYDARPGQGSPYAAAQEPVYAPQPIPVARPRRLWLGCLLAILAITFLCVGTLVFLDAYDQGRLLYCGPLRPFFQLVLGPVGFAPLCP